MRLEVFQQGQLLQELPIQEQEFWVGRDESCKIRLNDRSVSRKHALIRNSKGGGLEFEKVSEFGWIRLNGKESSHSKLKAGDRLELGPFEIRVMSSTDAPAVKTEVQPTQDQALILETPVTSQEGGEAASPDFQLSAPEAETSEPSMDGVSSMESQGMEVPGMDVPIETAPISNEFEDVSQDGATRLFSAPANLKPILNFGSGNQYEVTEDEVAIGRSQQCHVVLEDKRSSRKHSLIKKVDGKYYIKDLGSANGTLLNGERVDENELQSGDELQIGDTRFTFEMVQLDYEVKKQEFISVPEPEIPEVPQEIAASGGYSAPNEFQPQPMDFGGGTAPHVQPQPMPSFEAPKEEKKSLIGKMLDRYRMMNTKQQIIYGALVLGGLWLMLEEDVEEKKVKLKTGQPVKTAQKGKDEKGEAASTNKFEMLTPEQKRYIDTQYQISFESYKNREYDTCLLELAKIFSLVHDYKNAREIESFAKEGKRKLEAQEEERKRKEQERQAQLRLQGLIEQVGHLMDEKKYKEAEAMFPEIELLQPENQAVGEWRKRIVAETEKIEKEKEQQRMIQEQNLKAAKDFESAKELIKEKKYYEALDRFDEIVARNIQDAALLKQIKDEIAAVEFKIGEEKEPFLTKGKEYEQEGKLSEAYRSYEKALEVDPMDDEAPAGMKRIKGILTEKAKSIYTDGVFAESYGDIDTAEKKFKEVLEVVPKNDPYYIKADSKLRKMSAFKKGSTEAGP